MAINITPYKRKDTQKEWGWQREGRRSCQGCPHAREEYAPNLLRHGSALTLIETGRLSGLLRTVLSQESQCLDLKDEVQLSGGIWIRQLHWQ